MSKAWRKAIRLSSFSEWFDLTDGDFIVNLRYPEGSKAIGMIDIYKIPEVNDDVYKRILDFAEKRDLEVVKVKPRPKKKIFHSIELKRKPKNRKGKLKSLISDNSLKQIFVGDNMYTAKNPVLFEEFGSEVCGLKTKKEKELTIKS